MKLRRFLIIFMLFILLGNQVKAQMFSLGVNGLAAAAMVLNINGEIGLNHSNSIGVDLLLKPVRLDPRCSKMFVGRLYGRKYYKENFVGPFLGYSAGYLNYLIGDDNRKGYGALASLSLGYGFILSKRFCMNFEVGASLVYSIDRRYIVTPGLYDDDYLITDRRVHLLPFPVSFSISYLF